MAPTFTCSRCDAQQTCSMYGCEHRWKFPETMTTIRSKDAGCSIVCLACAPQAKFEWEKGKPPQNPDPPIVDPKSCWCRQ